MAVESIAAGLSSVLTQTSFSEALSTLEPMVIFVAGMVIYTVFIFKFYKFISKKDMFRMGDRRRNSAAMKIAFVLEYIFLYPVIAFSWFLVISILLSMLSVILTIGDIFMISMSVLATVRITSYYNEDLSSDIAKLIPYALLGVFLLDIKVFSPEIPFKILNKIGSASPILLYYFTFLVLVEFSLKVFSYLLGLRKKHVPKKSKGSRKSPGKGSKG